MSPGSKRARPGAAGWGRTRVHVLQAQRHHGVTAPRAHHITHSPARRGQASLAPVGPNAETGAGWLAGGVRPAEEQPAGARLEPRHSCPGTSKLAATPALDPRATTTCPLVPRSGSDTEVLDPTLRHDRTLYLHECAYRRLAAVRCTSYLPGPPCCPAPLGSTWALGGGGMPASRTAHRPT